MPVHCAISALFLMHQLEANNIERLFTKEIMSTVDGLFFAIGTLSWLCHETPCRHEFTSFSIPNNCRSRIHFWKKILCSQWNLWIMIYWKQGDFFEKKKRFLYPERYRYHIKQSYEMNQWSLFIGQCLNYEEKKTIFLIFCNVFPYSLFWFDTAEHHEDRIKDFRTIS